MGTRELSKKQREIYDYITEFAEEQGFPPSVREIAAAVGLRSPSTVHSHLKVLDSKGMIFRDGRKMRAIKTIDLQNRQDLGWSNIPVVGRVTAGQPILAVEEVEGYIPYNTRGRSGTFYGLHIRGDSMVGAGILDGDLVIVRRQPDAVHGEIVVALLDEEATVKRYYNQNGEVLLVPENDAYDPIDGMGAVILGKVVGVYRDIA